MSESFILQSAKTWTEVARLVASYNQTIGSEGVANFFGYASLIKHHDDIKPESSRRAPEQGGVVNQKALLRGSVMNFNVLAYGEYAYRATIGTYVDDAGKTKIFRNIGLYAGLENAEGGETPGMNITVNPQDRQAAWTAYMKRELGEPPEGITFDNILDGTAVEKLKNIEGTESDKLGMYKLQVVNVQTDQGLVPAITVAINEESPFQFVGKTPMQMAHLILDGHGFRRPDEHGDYYGGTALEYFRGVLKSVRELGLKHERLEQIAVAIDKLARFYVDLEKLPINKQFTAAREELLSRYPGADEIYSPVPLAAERRDPVSQAVKELPDNQFSTTAEQKARRITLLHRTGLTNFSR